MDYYIPMPQHLGAALRSRRKELGKSQKEVAQMVGLLPKTISNLENNTGTSSIESMFKLLSALNMSIVLTPKPEQDSALTEW